MQRQFRQFKPSSNLDAESIDIASHLNVGVMRDLSMYRNSRSPYGQKSLARQALSASYRDRRVIKSALEYKRALTSGEYNANLSVQEQYIIQLKNQIQQLQQQVEQHCNSQSNSPLIQSRRILSGSMRPRSAGIMRTIQQQQVANEMLNYKLNQMANESTQLVLQNRINQLERQLDNANMQIRAYRDAISEKSYQMLIDLKDQEISKLQEALSNVSLGKKSVDDQITNQEDRIFELQELNEIYKKQLEALTKNVYETPQGGAEFKNYAPDGVDPNQALRAKQVLNDLNNYVKIVEDLRYKLERQQAVMDEKDGVVNQLQMEFDRLTKENRDKDEDIFRLNKDFKSNYDSVKKQQEIVWQLQRDLEKKDLTIDEYKLQLENEQQASAAKQARIAELEQMNDEKSREIVALKQSGGQVTRLTDENEALGRELAELRRAREEQAAQIASLEEQLAQRDKTIQDLESRVNMLEAKLTSSLSRQVSQQRIDEARVPEHVPEARQEGDGPEVDAVIPNSSGERPDGFAGAIADYAELAAGAAEDGGPAVETNVAAEPSVSERYQDYIAGYAAERLQPGGEEKAEEEKEGDDRVEQADQQPQQKIQTAASAELAEKLGAYAEALQCRGAEQNEADQEQVNHDAAQDEIPVQTVVHADEEPEKQDVPEVGFDQESQSSHPDSVNDEGDNDQAGENDAAEKNDEVDHEQEQQALNGDENVDLEQHSLHSKSASKHEEHDQEEIQDDQNNNENQQIDNYQTLQTELPQVHADETADEQPQDEVQREIATNFNEDDANNNVQQEQEAEHASVHSEEHDLPENPEIPKAETIEPEDHVVQNEHEEERQVADEEEPAEEKVVAQAEEQQEQEHENENIPVDDAQQNKTPVVDQPQVDPVNDEPHDSIDGGFQPQLSQENEPHEEQQDTIEEQEQIPQEDDVHINEEQNEEVVPQNDTQEENDVQKEESNQDGVKPQHEDEQPIQQQQNDADEHISHHNDDSDEHIDNQQADDHVSEQPSQHEDNPAQEQENQPSEHASAKSEEDQEQQESQDMANLSTHFEKSDSENGPAHLDYPAHLNTFMAHSRGADDQDPPPADE